MLSAHPFVALLRNRNMFTLWAGLSLSAIGDELYRIGVVWIAIGVAGTEASFLPAAQYAAVLVVSLLAGRFAERFSPRATMIATDLLRALLSMLPVVLWSTVGLSLFSLIASVLGLASLRALFDPALLSSVPRLAGSADRLQAANSLLDATARLARLAGPFIAGIASLVLPPIHLLTLNAFSLLASAAAIVRIGPALREASACSAEPAAPLPRSRWRLLQEFAIARRQPFVRYVLAANAVILAAWTLGLTLGVAMLIASQPPVGFEARPLTALGLVLGTYGAGDLLSNLFVAGHKPTNVVRFMFSGYIVLGLGLAALPLPLVLPLGPAQLPIMMAVAFCGGLGGPMFYLPMMTSLQTLFDGGNLRSILRLRLSLISLTVMIAAASGPYLFDHAGPAITVTACGAIIAFVGFVGVLLASAAWSPCAVPARARHRNPG